MRYQIKDRRTSVIKCQLTENIDKEKYPYEIVDCKAPWILGAHICLCHDKETVKMICGLLNWKEDNG